MSNVAPLASSSCARAALFAHFRAHLLPSLAWHADALGRHKGDLGRLGIIGGCDAYHGAPFYAAMAALRAGGELATVFCQGQSASVAIKALSPELMVLPALPAPAADGDADSEVDAASSAQSAARQQRTIAASARSICAMLPRLRSFAIGSGLGRDPSAHAAIAAVLDEIRAQGLPVVLDGDAIHLVCAQARVIAGNRRAVLTPNAAEFRRLYEATFAAEQDRVDWANVTEAMTALLLASSPPSSALPEGNASSGASDADSMRLPLDLAWARPAVRLARELGVAIVQKGPVDLITDGHCVLYCAAGGSPRRCGGQGDLLAGLSALFISYAHRPPAATTLASSLSGSSDAPSDTLVALYCACAIVRHSAAAAFALHRRSTTAPDILACIAPTMQHWFPVPDLDACEHRQQSNL